MTNGHELVANKVSVGVGTLSAHSSFRDKIDTIKQTVAKGASDAQLEMFLTLADRYGLDPFLKEIWFVPGVGIITSRDGYLKVAQRDPDFDGIVSAAVCAGDDFEMDPVQPTIRHRFGAQRGLIIGAYAVVFHKRRRPAVCFASLSEYRKTGGVWSTYTSAMICKVAEVMALKRQFGISGLVSEEEILVPGSAEAQAEVLHQKLAEAEAAGIDIAAKYPSSKQPKKPVDKFGMLEHFAALKKRFQTLGKEGEYYSVLGEHGFEKSNQIEPPDKAREIYRDMQMRIQILEMSAAESAKADTVDAVAQSVPADRDREGWVPSLEEMHAGGSK